MTEYIDRKVVEEMIENAEYIAPAFGLCGGYCIDDIDLSSIPAADVAPVVDGGRSAVRTNKFRRGDDK